MVVEIASWSDLGYRKLGPLPAVGGGLSPAEIADRLTRDGDYQVTPDNVWVRRHARRMGTRSPASIEVVTVFDCDSPLDDSQLAFMDQHATSKWTRFDLDGRHVRADYQDMVDTVRKAEMTEKPWRTLYRLSQALLFADPVHLRPMFRQHVSPCFFRLFPKGRIVVLRYDTAVDEASAVLRCLYAMAQAPLPELLKQGFRGVQTLQHWHMVSLTRLMPALLNFFSYLFYPFVGGVCANIPGLIFLFLLDPAQKHDPAPFPRNWLGLLSSSASFGREDADLVALLQSVQSPAHQRAGHHRHCHPNGFGIEERLGLLRWYIERLNRVLYELTDAANFTAGHDPDAAIDPVFGYEHQITVDRLLRKTLLAMSLDEAPAGNLMAFEIADLYDTLSERFGNHTNKTAFFKKLFNPQEGPALIAPRFAGMPDPFADYFAKLTNEVYATIEKTVLASVWRAGKVTPGGVLVRDKTLATEIAMPAPQFVAEVMRAYRNAHHGYFSTDPGSQNRPSRFLFMVNGNLPVEMSALPVLWWLAYLAAPSLVGWKHLPLGAFD